MTPDSTRKTSPRKLAAASLALLVACFASGCQTPSGAAADVVTSKIESDAETKQGKREQQTQIQLKLLDQQFEREKWEREDRLAREAREDAKDDARGRGRPRRETADDGLPGGDCASATCHG